MNYKTIMRDSVAYIENHAREPLDGEYMGQIYSYTEHYYNYLFSSYYTIPLDEYISKVRQGKNFGMEKELGSLVRRMPEKEEIEFKLVDLDEFYISGTLVDKSAEKIYDPMKVVSEEYEHSLDNAELKAGEGFFSLWWHDETYTMEYVKGTICGDIEKIPESQMPVRIGNGKYAVFYLKDNRGTSPEEWMKMLVHYVYGAWLPKHEGQIDRLGSTFQCFKNGVAYFCLPLLSLEKQEPEDTVYSIETWTKYIDEHITMNLTTTALAEQFHYSGTHFKRIFRYYYKMSVSDYIRKRKLQAAAEEIRQGEKCTEVAAKYNFKTYGGFSRAFQKEFGMTPATYSNISFEVVDLAQYYKEYRDRFTITYLSINEIKMIGQSVLQGKGEDADIPAQVCYWLDRDFPCLENTRFSCNRERREEKIALWYHMPERNNIEYILGPVVEEFDNDIPEEMIKVTVEGGKYAMFETDRESDKDNLPETLRMFVRFAFYGWIKEHEAYVDLNRITFERYVDNKIYLYVPIKDA